MSADAGVVCALGPHRPGHTHALPVRSKRVMSTTRKLNATHRYQAGLVADVEPPSTRRPSARPGPGLTTETSAAGAGRCRSWLADGGLWDALSHGYELLGFDQAGRQDEVFLRPAATSHSTGNPGTWLIRNK